jgi:hypothetical protein
MNIRLLRTYRSKKGNVTFVYGVSGTEKDLASFKEIQGEYYREDDNGQTLWFTTRCVGQSGTLIITTNNKIVPDMSKFDQAASLAKQFGISSSPAPVAETAPVADEGSLGDA